MVGIVDLSPVFLRALYRGLAEVKIRRSALAPFLTACVFVSIPCFVIAAFSTGDFQLWILCVGVLPLGLFAVASLFLLLFDRERLHTEEHLERRQALDIVESKSQGVLLGAVDLANMVNPVPELKKLPDAREEEDKSDG